MAPKKKTGRVMLVNASSNKPTAKRKKKSSSEEEQNTAKKKRSEELENKLVRVSKAKVQKPISEGVVKHIESLINSSILSFISKKKRTPDFELVNTQLTHLKQTLLQHLKKMKFPSSKLGNMKNLRRDLAEEQHKLEANQEILMSLNSEIEKAVEAAETMEDSTKAFKEKLASLKEQTTVINSDPLELPKGTFQVPTLHENAKKVKNPKAVLKQLSLMMSNPVYKGMHKLIEQSYAEISTHTS